VKSRPGQFDEGEPVAAAVTFSEAAQDPTGDTDPHEDTNPANYRLIEVGANHTLPVSAGTYESEESACLFLPVHTPVMSVGWRTGQ
jgi:hypothetical protein